MARTTSDDPAVLTDRGAFDRHQRKDAEGGPFSFMADDDPDLEGIVRSHAKATGQNPDKAWTDEHTRRNPAPAPAAPRGGPAPGRSPATPPGRTARPGGGSRSAPAAGRPSSGGRGGASLGSVSVDDGAGLLLGLFAYALAHAFLVAGPAGAKAWLAAKFLNRTGPAGAFAAAPHPDYPLNPSSDGPAPAYPAPGMFRQTGSAAPDYTARPSTEGPATNYPAGPWALTAPVVPGGVVR